MDNQSQSSQSSYDKYIAEINSRIQSDMIDIAPAEHREHLKEEIYKTELDWINTQYLKDQANSWDENQFKAEVDKIPKWTKHGTRCMLTVLITLDMSQRLTGLSILNFYL